MNPRLRQFLCPPSFKQWLWSVLRCFLWAYLLLILFALNANHFLFHPPGNTQPLPGEVKLQSADGNTITGQFMPNPTAAYVLLFSYGNGEELYPMQDFMQELKAHGWAVMGYDYPGYGTSTGRPSPAGCCAALDAAYAWLTQQKHIPPERIVLYGHSLGSGPSIDLASRKKIGGLILDGAYTSIFRVVIRYRILPWDIFDNLGKINQLHVPILFLHGMDDHVVPFWHDEVLYNAYNGPKQHLWVAGGGHGNLPWVAPEAYWGAVNQFRQSLPSHDSIKFSSLIAPDIHQANFPNRVIGPINHPKVVRISNFVAPANFIEDGFIFTPTGIARK